MQGLEKAQNLINYATTTEQLKQLSPSVALKTYEVIKELSLIFRIPLTLQMSEQEFVAEQQQQQALKMQAMQGQIGMGGVPNAEPVGEVPEVL